MHKMVSNGNHYVTRPHPEPEVYMYVSFEGNRASRFQYITRFSMFNGENPSVFIS